MKKSKRNKIANTCVEAISDAQDIYCKMSGGDWLLHAPEYFLSTMIALKIKDKIRKVRVTLENSTSEALEEAEAIETKQQRHNIHKDIRVDGRVDLLVWNNKNWPVGVIEVKNNCWDSEKIKSDLKRIKEMLQINNENNSLEFGIFTYYYSFFKGANKGSEDRKMKRTNNVAGYVSEIFDESFTQNIFHMESKSDKDGDFWGAYSILIQKT